MPYFEELLKLLQLEREEDRRLSEQMLHTAPVNDRRAAGVTWYPIAIRDTEIGRGDYLTLEVERPSFKDLIHQFRFGASVAIFSQHDAEADRIEGVVTYQSGDRMKISLRVDELPEWTRNGKLGVDLVFDRNSYEEMEKALKLGATIEATEERSARGHLLRILTGQKEASFDSRTVQQRPGLNSQQQKAIEKIINANELAIVHGPPGTGKTTTLVQSVRALREAGAGQLLVVAPSNAAVDLLTEKISEAGLNVVRIGNPARVSERLMQLTLDQKMNDHASMKQIRNWKKQAREYRDLAQKYKRSFGKDEREQRKALFAEAKNLGRAIEKEEKYIVDDLLGKADVITATLVGASHYTIRHLEFKTVVIDEAGQALEPACWIPILKAEKLVLAGDHQQLPPTIKSIEAAREGLMRTLLEKSVAHHLEAVVLLEEQYRMNKSIMSYSSSVFYENRLIAHESVANRVLFEGEPPLQFIDTAGCGFEEKWEGTSVSNPEEASFTFKHLERLLEEMDPQVHLHDIAVISPYKHQVELLKESLLNSDQFGEWKSRISVNTIDSFQGQEKDVVYISMVRSNSEGDIGFLSDTRRMNVAMTRAKRKLVVIGDSSTLSRLPFYAGLVEHAQSHEAYQSAWEYADMM